MGAAPDIDLPKLTSDDIKRIEAAARAAGDGSSADAGKAMVVPGHHGVPKTWSNVGPGISSE